jgi:hypothetical protein
MISATLSYTGSVHYMPEPSSTICNIMKQIDRHRMFSYQRGKKVGAHGFYMNIHNNCKLFGQACCRTAVGRKIYVN